MRTKTTETFVWILVGLGFIWGIFWYSKCGKYIFDFTTTVANIPAACVHR